MAIRAGEGDVGTSGRAQGAAGPELRDAGPPRLAHLGAFLRSRRERLWQPAVRGRAGRRRTPGLRREDVADAARISVAWYTRLEQGQDVHPSVPVLHAIAEALRLDVAERAYLFRLALAAPSGNGRADRPTPILRAVDVVPSPAAPDGTPPTLRHLLDSMTAPALLMDRYWDVVGRNAALETFVPGLGPVRTRPDVPPRNVVRHVLTTTAAREHGGQAAGTWEVLARACVGGLRATLADVWADDPDDPHAAALVTALTRESLEFRAWWPEHNVWAGDRPLRRTYEHPSVGSVAVEIMLHNVRSARGLMLVTYAPADGASAAKLEHLALESRCPPMRGTDHRSAV